VLGADGDIVEVIDDSFNF